MRVLKEGGMDAIKLEGGSPSRITAAKSVVEAGIAVMGHVGLTPQAISVLGGFRPQGRNVASAVKVCVCTNACVGNLFSIMGLHVLKFLFVVTMLYWIFVCRLWRQHWLCKKLGAFLLF